MIIPPIKEGPRISREEAIRELRVRGFTEEEAKRFLDEPDVDKRKAITDAITKRVKEKNET